MEKKKLTLVICMILISILITGCMGVDSTRNKGIDQKKVYEESISNMVISDQVDGSLWTGTGGIAVDLDGVAVGYPSAEVARPEHFYKAMIEVKWQSSTQDAFEGATVAAGPAPSFNSPWTTDSGSDVLNLEVDEHQWAKGDMLLELYPGENPDSLSFQYDLNVEFVITLVEHVPISESKEIPEEGLGDRGSNEPKNQDGGPNETK